MIPRESKVQMVPEIGYGIKKFFAIFDEIDRVEDSMWY